MHKINTNDLLLIMRIQCCYLEITKQDPQYQIPIPKYEQLMDVFLFLHETLKKEKERKSQTSPKDFLAPS